MTVSKWDLLDQKRKEEEEEAARLAAAQDEEFQDEDIDGKLVYLIIACDQSQSGPTLKSYVW